MIRLRHMQWTKWSGLLLFTLSAFFTQAQVTGGRYAMEFLRLPNAPHISALGGINVANPDQDISFAGQNPALMRPGLHNQLGLNQNFYYSSIGVSNLLYGYHLPKINTSFALGVQYINYGTLTETDNIGNVYGTYRANDYNINLTASRQYGQHWRYGATLKWAHSKLYTNTASAILADIGVNYYDTASLWDIGIVAKNIGFMVDRYTTTNSAEPLPLDVQIGISKRFKHMPLRLMANMHHLYEWDIRYDNPADAQTSLLGGTDTTTATKRYFGEKLMRHFIFAAELTLAKRLTVTAAYNYLRRSEMLVKDKPALAGFSFGAGLYLNKFQVHYARSYYSLAGAYNEIGLNMQLNQLFGIGKFGNKVGWKDTYTDWQ